MALSLESKSTVSLDKEAKDTGITWDEANQTWDEANGTWENPGRQLSKESKSTVNLNLETK